MGIAYYVTYELWDLGKNSYLFQSTHNTHYSVVFGGNSIELELRKLFSLLVPL